MPVVMTGCSIVTQRPVAGSKRSPVPSGSPIGVIAQLQRVSTTTTPTLW